MPDSPISKLAPSRMTSEAMRAISLLHGDLEGRCELEPLMDTLVDEPVFEFHPPGGRLVGGATLRRYYEHFLDAFIPLVRGSQIIGEWADAHCYVVETQIFVEVAGRVEAHQLSASMYGSGDRLGGERIYGSATVIDLMLGPYKAELLPIEGVSPFARG